jgi:hypothetical protein
MSEKSIALRPGSDKDPSDMTVVPPWLYKMLVPLKRNIPGRLTVAIDSAISEMEEDFFEEEVPQERLREFIFTIVACYLLGDERLRVMEDSPTYTYRVAYVDRAQYFGWHRGIVGKIAHNATQGRLEVPMNRRFITDFLPTLLTAAMNLTASLWQDFIAEFGLAQNVNAIHEFGHEDV